MKRDMDLIRQLLLRIEALPAPADSPVGGGFSLNCTTEPLRLGDEKPEEIQYHMRLLADAGFFKLTKTQFAGSFNLTGLSWDGHDFLDSVRDEATWRKTKEGAVAAGGYTVQLLADLAKGFLRKQIEEYTGIKV